MTVQDAPALTAPELTTDPFGGFGRLREQAPVLRSRFGLASDETPLWLVTRYADVKAVLSDPRFVNDPASVPGGGEDARASAFASMGIEGELGEYLTSSVLDVDGADHTRLRKLVSRAFTVRRVGELRPRVEEITKELLDALAAAPQPVDLVEAFCYPLPITVICELVGIPVADRPAWHDWGRALVAMDPARIPQALRGAVTHIEQLIEARKAAPADDLLTALVRVREEDGDRLSDRELVTMVLALVIAGHETTAHLIGNATVALLTHPGQLAALRERPELWPQAVAELMRRWGPIGLVRPRYATEEVEIGGVTIPAGAAVQPVLVSANGDPREFADPAAFDVTRPPAGRGEGHVGFGHGAHYCLGAALARQEAEVALRALFTRFPGLALAVDPAELQWQARPGFRALAALPVRVTG